MTTYLAVKHAEAIALICACLSILGSAQRFQLNDPSASVCGENEFRCQNGECIQSELLCDGRPDCSDQSDETRAECTKPESTCPGYTFRCNYGACVNGDATCNGVKDCLDNSDETLARCPGISAADPDASCGPGNYRCRNGQCINSASLCDGTVDCTDGSDETSINCGSFPCSQYAFRCNYGGCIDGDLKCNNVSNCADGSDEDPMLCRRPEPGPFTDRPITPGLITTPTPRRACLVPPQPNNGYWKLDKTLCDSYGGSGNVDCDVSQGIELEPGSLLVYRCIQGYKIKGNSEVYCVRGGTWSAIPVCTEIKCSVLNSPSLSATCTTIFGAWISCDSATPPGTRAEVMCRSGYRKDTTSITTRRESVQCNPSGQWEPDPIKCIPVCGRPNIDLTPLVWNGQAAKLADFPWHATLYLEEKTATGSKKAFQCGGTIIQPHLVLTAAHCIYDETTSTTKDPKKFFVMTGNLFRDYDFPFHNNVTVQKRAVKNVYRHCNYYGTPGKFASDIALLELAEAFKVSEIVAPACLDMVGESVDILEVGAVGKVAGFGRTATGPSSGNLQTIKLPYISRHQCQTSQNGTEDQFFIGADKFCAGYSNGSAVCDGDSGGGLVFQNRGLWYVMGIVSVGLGLNVQDGERKCNSFSYSLYTRVGNYIDWIQDIILQLERNKSYPSCNPNI